MAEIQQSGQLNEVEERDQIANQNVIGIQNLKKQLEEKDKEIELLKKRICEIRQQNDALEGKLRSKDKEIERLNKRIKELENDKIELKEKVTRLENKVERLERSSSDKDKEIQKLNKRMEKMEHNMKLLGDLLDNKDREHKEEVKKIKESTHRALPTSQYSIWLIEVGQLCRMIQDKMYQKVLPLNFHKEYHYKIDYIKGDVKGDQPSAQRWQNLKLELNWSEKIEEMITFIEDQRNYEAHPKINVQALEEKSEGMKRNGCLKGRTADVMKLFEIWKRLNRC